MSDEQDVNGGEWYADGRYVRNHRRAVAIASCQDEDAAARIVVDHNAALAQRTAPSDEASLRTLLTDWLNDCSNEDCTLCHRTRAALDRAPRPAGGVS